jgi:hypothetical protein
VERGSGAEPDQPDPDAPAIRPESERSQQLLTKA